jgi:hypothetical protein
MLIAGPRQYAVAKNLISLVTLVGTPTLPVGEVMSLTTVAPLVPIFERAVREESAAVAGKVDNAPRSVRRTDTNA